MLAGDCPWRPFTSSKNKVFRMPNFKTKVLNFDGLGTFWLQFAIQLSSLKYQDEKGNILKNVTHLRLVDTSDTTFQSKNDDDSSLFWRHM